MDVTDARTEDIRPASGCTTSGAEHLQQIARGARVVKAFNTQFAWHIDSGRLGTEPLTTFVASWPEVLRGAGPPTYDTARQIECPEWLKA